ncbi:DUF3658 domain-containing protein [Lacibacterium aquatile]|uniref:DUF3658 domain-containing protein n=1 Tax=Lacibacterium aquatile TaxID=1168082 RepID=A0ABW5DSG5_9PROT
MTKPLLHVTFHPSAALSLREALNAAGRADKVVTASDDFSFGPLDPLDPVERGDWVAEELGFSDWVDAAIDTDAAFKASRDPDVLPVAWFSRRDVQSYMGFLAWLGGQGDAPCAIVDLTEVEVDDLGVSLLVISPSLLTAESILDGKLLEQARPLTAEERTRYLAEWNELKADNAPLRVLGDEGILSAPIDGFDPLLLSCAGIEWRSMAGVLIEAIEAAQQGDLHRTSGDLFLMARLYRLIEEGELDGRGDLLNLHEGEVKAAALVH